MLNSLYSTFLEIFSFNGSFYMLTEVVSTMLTTFFGICIALVPLQIVKFFFNLVGGK